MYLTNDAVSKHFMFVVTFMFVSKDKGLVAVACLEWLVETRFICLRFQDINYRRCLLPEKRNRSNYNTIIIEYVSDACTWNDVKYF